MSRVSETIDEGREVEAADVLLRTSRRQLLDCLLPSCLLCNRSRGACDLQIRCEERWPAAAQCLQRCLVSFVASSRGCERLCKGCTLMLLVLLLTMLGPV